MQHVYKRGKDMYKRGCYATLLCIHASLFRNNNVMMFDGCKDMQHTCVAFQNRKNARFDQDTLFVYIW